MSEHVTIQDPYSHRVTWLNRAVMEATEEVNEVSSDLFCFKIRFGLSQPCPECPARRTLQTGRPSESLVTNKGRSWSIRIFPIKDMEGNVTEVVELALEVTEYRRLQRRFKTLFELIPDAVIVVDLEGRVVSTNASGAKLHGFDSPEDMIGLKGVDMVVPEDRERLLENLANVVSTGEIDRQAPSGSPDSYEYTIVRKDGRRVSVSLASTLLRSPTGEPEAVMGFLRDITKQKEIENALRQERNLVRNILDASPIGILVLTEDSRVVYSNSEVDKLIDLAGPIAPGSKVLLPRWSAVSRNSGEREETPLLEMVMATRQPVYDALYRIEGAKDGKEGERYLLCNAVPMISGHRENDLVVVTMEDVTHRIMAERRIAERESRYRALFEHTADAVVVVEVETDGRILVADMNRAAEMQERIQKADAIGRNLHDALPSLEAFGFDNDILEVWETGRGKWAGDRSAVLSDKGQSFREGFVYKLPTDEVVLVYRDITLSRLAEMELKTLTERLKVLRSLDRGVLTAGSLEELASGALEHLPLLVPADGATIVLFDEKGERARVLAQKVRIGVSIYQDVGDQWFTLDSYKKSGSLDILMKEKFVLLNDLEDTAPFEPDLEPLQTLRLHGRKSALFVALAAEEEIVGSLNLVSNRKAAFDNDHVRVAVEVADGLAVAIRQARLQEKIRRHALELEEKVKERTENLRSVNEELETFAYSVSHDLRAPLRSMQGFAKALLEDYSNVLDDQGIDFANRIVESAKGMDKLITDLLEYSRMGRKEIPLKAVDLSSAVRVVLGQLSGILADAIVENDVGSVMVTAHPATLVQVITNLISNAVKFVSPGTVPRVKLYAEDSGNIVRLWVEDNGIGIDKEYIDKVFKVFERLHSADKYPGTGIGLATVKRAMEKMNGRIGVESTPGEGSKFWVEFEKAGHSSSKA